MPFTARKNSETYGNLKEIGRIDLCSWNRNLLVPEQGEAD